MNLQYSLIFLISVFIFQTEIVQAESITKKAYIKFGAVILSEASDPETGKHKRVGYLPIGTLVQHGNRQKKIFNYSQDIQGYEDYIFIKSSTGYSGYVTKELLVSLGTNEIIVPLRYNLIIRDIDTNEIISKVSRAKTKDDGESLKILNEDGEQYIVEFIDNNEVKIGKVYKSMVDGEHFVKLPGDSDNFKYSVNVSSPRDFISEKLKAFSEYVSDKAGTNVEKVVEFLSSLNALQCRISSVADAELSGKIFGNGLGLKFKFVIAEKNSIYSISSLEVLNKDYVMNYYQFHNVKCINGIPNRLENYILLSKSNTSNQVILSKIQLPERLRNNWVTFDTNTSRKMIIINGINAYTTFMKHIGKAKYLASLPYSERLFLSNTILKQVAIFETPK